MRTRRSQGFTLVELMVSLVVGAIFVGSVFAVTRATSRTFQRQYGLSQMQTSLRSAMNQIKRDIARAGLHATPNAGLPDRQLCGPPQLSVHNPGTSMLAGIARFANNCGASDCPLATGLNTTQNNVQFDSIVLLGNYATSDQYPTRTVQAVSGVSTAMTAQVQLDQEWHAFQRDFSKWYRVADNQGPEPGSGPLVGAFDLDRFLDAFPLGRMIAIRGQNGAQHFAKITVQPTGPGNQAQNSNPEGVRINFAPLIPPRATCDLVGGWVAPLSLIRYVVEDVPDNTALAERNPAVQGKAMQLVRREIDPSGAAELTTPMCRDYPANCMQDRIVLDYVVDFNIDFLLATPTGPDQPDLVPEARVTGGPGGLGSGGYTAVSTNPELVRTVIVSLATRTPEVDSDFAHRQFGGKPDGTPASLWDPLLTYFEPLPGLSTSAPKATRVRAMRAEIFVPNIAYRGY